MRTYSNDLRSRVLKEIGKGRSCRQAARVFGISASTAVKWAQAWKRDGRSAALPKGGDRRSALRGEREWLLRQIEKTPDMTLMELRAALQERGVHVGYGTVWRFFDKEGISFKKNRIRNRAKAR